MSEYDINKPCWTWASADGAVGAGNTVHVGYAGGGAAGRSSSINARVSRDVRAGEVLTRDTVTGEVWASPTSPQPVLPDHAGATVAALQRIIDKLNAGTSPEDLGRDVELLGRIMARRT